jgi:hypothetical protein
MVDDFRIAYEGNNAESNRIAHIYETQFDSKLFFPVDKTSPDPRFHPNKSLPPASSIPELHVLLDPQRAKPPPAQRTLAKVAHSAQWLVCLDRAIKKDAAYDPLTH